MMGEPEQLLKKVISSQYFAVLNSVGNGLPYSNLVSFAVTKDLKSLVFVTDRDTRKYKNIKENKDVSLMIDNRANRPSDIVEAVAITLIGIAREESGNNENLKALLLGRHPQLQDFIYDPNAALIVVNVSEFIIAGFKKTQHLVI
jgi:heme iron utilization protein